jgi:acetylornithine deacetylase/succinyl-diaminopimelate desuccinylase-like protein
MNIDELTDRVLQADPNEPELTSMVCDLVNIRSEAGGESECARYLRDRLAERGFRARLQEVEEGRHNVLGILDTGKPGPTLMFMGHMDTSTYDHVDGPLGQRSHATLDNGWVFGLGVSNMKSAFAAYIHAVEMLKTQWSELTGRILVAGVVGETERAPVGDWEGRCFRGGGIGAQYMATHGGLADYCINGEPTGLKLQRGNAGYMFVEITFIGSAQHAFSKANAIDPIPRAMRAYDMLEVWGQKYSDRHQDEVMRPLVNVGAIHGGEAFKPSRTAEACSLYMNLNFVRGQTVMSVERELREALSNLFSDDPKAKYEVDVYLAKQPDLLDMSSPLIGAMSVGHEKVFHEPLPEASPPRYSVSSDNPVFSQFGVQGIQYGAGGIGLGGGITVNEPGIGEVVSMEKLAACTKVYAAAAAWLLGIGN